MKASTAHLGRFAQSAHDEEITRQISLRDSHNLTVTAGVILANDLGVRFLMVTTSSGYVVPVLGLAVAQLARLGLREALRLRPTRRPGHAGSVAT